MIVKLIDFGANITNEIIGGEIYTYLSSVIENDTIEIDFNGIRVMTTKCAKQIFGRLLEDLGSEVFFRKFSFANADDNIQYIISIGISSDD
jgi:hypothetical protein